MVNVLTIDVEEYFHVANFESVIGIEQWEHCDSRVERSTDFILDLLDEENVKATFFILGWVADRHRLMVRRIHSRGHEVASHGYLHRRIYTLNPNEFRDDTLQSKSVLEDITGEEVSGYRAASCSITANSMWAIDILIEAGFKYDSSIFPIWHDRYGIPGHDRFVHSLKGTNGGEITEIPFSTISVGGSNFPVAGGGYFRLFPYFVTKRAIRHINKNENQPVNVYFHPWEIDPGQPRIKVGLLSSLRHYANLSQMEKKLRRLLSDFSFAPVKEVYKEYL